MARPGVSFELSKLPGPVRDEMVRRLIALVGGKPGKAEAIARDAGVLGRAFGELSALGKTVVSGLARETTRLELATRVLARHGATEGDAQALDEADRALAKELGAVIERWPAVSDNGYAFRASLQLIEPLATTVAGLADQTFVIPRVGDAGSAREESAVASPLALSLVPGAILQRARLTAGRQIHGTVAKKLAAILPRIEAHARVWIETRAIERDESGTPRLDLARAKRVIESLSGLAMIETLVGEYVDETERALVGIAAMAAEGDTLDLIAMMDAAGAPAMRLERPFRVLAVDVARNRARLPRALHRILRGGAGGSGQRSFVQPDFEVVLSDATSLADAMIIGCAAELEHFGTVARLRLTKLALQKARVSGITKEMVVEALQRATGKTLPTNVATALSEWSGGVGIGTLREAIVLSLDGDAGQLDRAARVLEAITARRPEPGLFVLSAMPKSKHFEQLRAIGLHVTSEIEARRARELAASSSYDEGEADDPHEETFSAHEVAERGPRLKQREDLRFVEGGLRETDARKVLDPKRIERILQRSVPPQKPYALAIAESTQRYVYEDEPDTDLGDDDDDDEDDGVASRQLDAAFVACRSRFGHRRDWLVELDAIEDLDATRSLQIGAPEILRDLLLTAPSPAMLRLVIVNSAERLLAERSRP